MSDSLAREAVAPRLLGRFGRRYVFRESCASTQRLLGPDDVEGTVAVADEQTEGRGRLGRSWIAAPRTSVLCSVLLRPPVTPARLPELSLVAGRACAAAIARATGLVPEIKFPNDVLVRGRKVAGVLAEARGGDVLLGVGINANASREQLPTDTALSATSLRIETGRPVDRAELLVTLLDELERAYDAWVAAARG
jgi:BirA family transcriptional regulator, biotin operon repressor / biotin---[acetyl-CoA-carboxylase] ligase